MAPPRVKWTAELAHVREVSLAGSADLAYWTDKLAADGLAPVERNGRARIMLIAADSKFLGVPFRELSVSVPVAPVEQPTGSGGAYLVCAFDTCRFFAFCERTFFSTPYVHGDVRVSARMPASIELVMDGQRVFRAEMLAEISGAERTPFSRGEGGWDGPVFLPGRGIRRPRAGKLFFARIRGDTLTYPFVAGADSLTISPCPKSRSLQSLVDSQFVATEWAVRADATHAKSKTYRRSQWFADANGAADAQLA